ncbi:MAG: hypothetical protein FWF97_04665 [Alphaproteobacteria bacterium]|nr:hypothetical protein [Alphaproteobacteria bacterium]
MTPKLPDDIFDKKSPEQRNFAVDKLLEKVSKERNEEFGRYLTGLFVRTMKQPNIAGRILGFGSMTNDVKVDFTQSFMDALIDLINKDIDEDKVKIYNQSGELINGPDSTISKHSLSLFKEDIKIPKMKVADVPRKGFQMGMGPTKDLGINFDWPLYKMTDCFLMDLRHESGHVVDVFAPNISPIGNISLEASRNYVSPEENPDYYARNPHEGNANTGRSEYADAIRQALKEIEAGAGNFKSICEACNDSYS